MTNNNREETMSELERVEDEVLDEEWFTGWVTTDFQAAAAGVATLAEDGVDRLSLPVVGWLTQETVAVERHSGRVGRWSVTRRRTVAGFVGPTGEVVALDQITVRGTEGALAWNLRVNGTGTSGAEDLVVNVTIQPAPVHVEILPEPATRRVVRDQYGQISAVVAEP